jgi:hypothetical protein
VWEACHHDYSTWDTGPNSHLMFQNSVFDFIRDGRTIHLAHVTAALDDILRDGALFPSAGCLVGSVYCVPALRTDGDDFRLHNLGGYYYLREVPLALDGKPTGANAKSQPSILLIEVERGASGYEIEGVNYLRMGKVHFDIFDSKANLLGQDEIDRLQEKVIGGVRSQESFLIDCVRQHLAGEATTAQYLQFLRRASAAVTDIPYLGYVLFEAFSVTLMILQDDDFSAECRAVKEFNNWNYKELMYGLYPKFGTRFRLSDFQPDWQELLARIKAMDLRVDEAWFIRSVARRARKYICDNCFIDHRAFQRHRTALFEPISWNWASAHMSPLLGHMLHRELRNVTPERHQELFRFFEQEKATSIWNYWNKRGVAVPFNGVVPKGEMGPNPCFTKGKISIYLGEVSRIDGRNVYVRKGEPLKLKLEKRLGELRHAFRRDHA